MQQSTINNVKLEQQLNSNSKSDEFPSSPNSGNTLVSCCGYKIKDKVNTPFGIGIVWKVTNKSVHVKHPFNKEGIEWLYSKYLVITTHHSQNPVSVLSHSS